MATPLQRRASQAQRTPGSKSFCRTPQPALTPNDDASERASVRRQRRSEALRMSLSDAFSAGGSDQQQQQGAGGGGGAKPTLPQEALDAMFDLCIKLAAENKITDRNVWQLQLISHLPDMVARGSRGGGGGPGSRADGPDGFNFQKASGGLDAGVAIYSKRVDHTYKEAFQSLQGASRADDADGTAGGADDDGDADGAGGGDDDGTDAAAGRAGKAKGRGARSAAGLEAREEATLARREALASKAGAAGAGAAGADPLFQRTSALFDEGGAKGLLQLNRSVYSGTAIMTDPHEVPEAVVPLHPPPAQHDALLDLRHLRAQLDACWQLDEQQRQAMQQQGGAGDAAGAALLAPGLEQLHALLGQAVGQLLQQQPGGAPGQQQWRAWADAPALDVAAVMAQATQGVPDTPMPAAHNSGTQPAAAAGASDGMDWQQQQPDSSGDDAAGPDADAGGSRPSAVAAFLAASADDAELHGDLAAEEAGWQDDDDGAGGMDGGYSDDGGDDDAGGTASPGGGRAAQQQQQERGMLGLAAGASSGAAAEGLDVLDAEALQQLLGSSGGGGPAGSCSAGSGWAGSSFWRYRAAAAAISRLGQAPTSKGAAAGGARRARAAAVRIDFEQLPQLPPGALATGSRKQTCLVTAPSGPAPTLLPLDLHYQASSLSRLFLKPSTHVGGLHRHSQPGGSNSGAAAGGAHAAGGWEDDDDGGGWGDGCYDDGDGDGGMQGSAGFSAGDPGFEGGGSSGGAAGGGWWSAERELLAVPARAAGAGGVSYNRSSKQVDVRALKDLLWARLLHINGSQGAGDSSPAGGDDAAADAAVPFQAVIGSVPPVSGAGPREDVSVAMCFICLLHLANEQGLAVRGGDDLASLCISHVPAAAV